MNKKYFQLDNKTWLAEQRKIKTAAELALEVGCHRSSITFAERFFSDSQKATFRVARKHIKADGQT